MWPACQHLCHLRTQAAAPVPAVRAAVRPDVPAEVQPAVRPDVPADAPADVQTDGQPDVQTDGQPDGQPDGRASERTDVQKVAVLTTVLLVLASILCGHLTMETAVKRKVMETPAVAEEKAAMWASGPSIQFLQASPQAVASTAVVALVQQQVGTWVSVPAWPPLLQQLQLPR
jgi:hypothetical protein